MKFRTPQKSIRLNQLMIGGFGIVVAITVIANATTYFANRTLRETKDSVAQAYQVKAELRGLEKSLVDAETGQRGFLFTNQPRYLEPYDAATGTLAADFASLGQLMADNPEQLARLEEVETLAEQKLEELATTIDLKRQGQEEAVLELVLSDLGKEIMEQIRVELAEMIAVEEQLLAERLRNADRAETLSAWVNWLNLIGITGVAIVVSIIVTRSLTQSLNQAFTVAHQVAEGDLVVTVETASSDEIDKLISTLKRMAQRLSQLILGAQQSGIQVTSSATQIAASGKQLEATMREQTATTTETASTAQEIAATAQELVATMDEVAALSQATTSAATSSQTSLHQMEETIRQLSQATTTIAAQLGAISDRANTINSVVTTINKVADQTNLLSLNASIEAEKAGEYGAGFGVVAREIRRLADQTAVATLEIENMVQEMQSSVSSGVMEMDKFSAQVTQSVQDVVHVSGQVGQIIQQVQELSPRFALVNQGVESQAQGAQQISEAMSQLSTVSMQTTDSLNGINEAIAQLNQAAQQLQQEMDRFNVDKATDAKASQSSSSGAPPSFDPTIGLALS